MRSFWFLNILLSIFLSSCGQDLCKENCDGKQNVYVKLKFPEPISLRSVHDLPKVFVGMNDLREYSLNDVKDELTFTGRVTIDHQTTVITGHSNYQLVRVETNTNLLQKNDSDVFTIEMTSKSPYEGIAYCLNIGQFRHYTVDVDSRKNVRVAEYKLDSEVAIRDHWIPKRTSSTPNQLYFYNGFRSFPTVLIMQLKVDDYYVNLHTSDENWPRCYPNVNKLKELFD